MEASNASNVQSVHSRRYMSKSQRACDFCRERKSACRIEGGVPCQLCSYYKRQCTFNSSSSARRKRGLTNTDNNAAPVAPPARPDSAGTGLGDGGSLLPGMQNNSTPPALESQEFDAAFQSYDMDSFPDFNDNNILLLSVCRLDKLAFPANGGNGSLRNARTSSCSNRSILWAHWRHGPLPPPPIQVQPAIRLPVQEAHSTVDRCRPTPYTVSPGYRRRLTGRLSRD
jgi:hypothetical protein